MISTCRTERLPAKRVRELTWALIDDRIEDAEWSELQALVTDSANARRAYIDVMKLHVDLSQYYLSNEIGQERRSGKNVALAACRITKAAAAEKIRQLLS